MELQEMLLLLCCYEMSGTLPQQWYKLVVTVLEGPTGSAKGYIISKYGSAKEYIILCSTLQTDKDFTFLKHHLAYSSNTYIAMLA